MTVAAGRSAQDAHLKTLAAENFGCKEFWLQVAIPPVLTSLLDRNDSHLCLKGLILRVRIDPYYHDKTARRAAAGPSAPAVDVSVLVVVLDDPRASIDVADGRAGCPTSGDVCSKTVAIKPRGSGHHVIVRLLFQVDPSEPERLPVVGAIAEEGCPLDELSPSPRDFIRYALPCPLVMVFLPQVLPPNKNSQCTASSGKGSIITVSESGR